MGFPGLPHSAPERYALFVLNDGIGGSMSSRLFQEVRERQGLVYSIHSGVQAYTDTGTVYGHAATDAPNFSKVLKSTLKELRDLKKAGVTQEELKRAKDHLKGSLMLSLESTSSRMNRLAKQEMHHGSFLTIHPKPQGVDRGRPPGGQGAPPPAGPPAPAAAGRAPGPPRPRPPPPPRRARRRSSAAPGAPGAARRR